MSLLFYGVPTIHPVNSAGDFEIQFKSVCFVQPQAVSTIWHKLPSGSRAGTHEEYMCSNIRSQYELQQKYSNILHRKEAQCSDRQKRLPIYNIKTTFGKAWQETRFATSKEGLPTTESRRVDMDENGMLSYGPWEQSGINIVYGGFHDGHDNFFRDERTEEQKRLSPFRIWIDRLLGRK